jgi:hypothetical protein
VPNPEEIEQARSEAARMRTAVAAKLRSTAASREPSRHSKKPAQPPRGATPMAAAGVGVAPREGDQIVQAEIQLLAPGPLAHAPDAALPAQLRLRRAGAGGELTALPFDPVTLAFRGIRYFVPNPAFRKAAAKEHAAAELAAASGGGQPEDLEAPAAAPGAAAAGSEAEAEASAEAAAKLAAAPRLELLKVG